MNSTRFVQRKRTRAWIWVIIGPNVLLLPGCEPPEPIRIGLASNLFSELKDLWVLAAGGLIIILIWALARIIAGRHDHHAESTRPESDRGRSRPPSRPRKPGATGTGLKRKRLIDFREIRKQFKKDRTPIDGETISHRPLDQGDPATPVLAGDLTEHQRMEDALRKSEERLRQAVRVSQLGIFDHDHLSNVIYWSPEQRIIHGWDAKQPITLATFLDSVHPDDRARIAAAVQHAHGPTSDGAYDVEHRIIRNGEIRWIVTRSQTFFEGQGAARHKVRTVGAVLDITERKRTETELQRYREHLEERVAERTAALRRSNEELRQAMYQLVQTEKLAALGNLVAGIAHELNTPLGNVRTMTSALGEEMHTFAATIDSGVLRRSQVDHFLNRSREAMELLERNAARAADLISHFKQVAVDQTSTRRRRFFLRQTLEELLTALQPQFKHTAHRIELDIPSDLELDSYPGPLEQVITNLILNSFTHGFERVQTGIIRIGATPLGFEEIQIDYTDNGVGMPEKILKRVFEPFFTTRPGQGGSGLGLYIVHNLITGVLGGTIQVQCGAPLQGISFTLTLPRSGPANHPNKAPPA